MQNGQPRLAVSLCKFAAHHHVAANAACLYHQHASSNDRRSSPNEAAQILACPLRRVAHGVWRQVSVRRNRHDRHLDRPDEDTRWQQFHAHVRLQTGRHQAHRNGCRPRGRSPRRREWQGDGDKFSFSVSFNGATITHTGTIAGDEIKMSSKSDSGDFPPMQMTLKRSK